MLGFSFRHCNLEGLIRGFFLEDGMQLSMIDFDVFHLSLVDLIEEGPCQLIDKSVGG